MTRRRLAAVLFALAVALGLGHALSYSTMLPERVATQFDAAGVPVSWSARSTMIDLQLTLVVLLAAAFLMAVGAILKSPGSWLPLPHRRSWLDPCRADTTRGDLACRLLCLGALTQLLLFDLFHHAVRVNLGRTPVLEDIWLDVGVFTGVMAVWLVALLWRYARGPRAVA
jgi:hypothetical protein